MSTAMWSIDSTDGKRFLYGFLAHKQCYFLIRDRGGENGKCASTYVVGGTSGVPGTWNYMFKALVKHKCIPSAAEFSRLLKTVGPTEAVIGKQAYQGKGCNPQDNMWLDEMHRWNVGCVCIAHDGVREVESISGNTITVKDGVLDS